MRSAARHVAIDDLPEVESLAEEVRATNEPIVLRRKGKDVARIVPLESRTTAGRKTRRPKTAADMAAFLSSAGSWSNFDADAFLKAVRESRDIQSRPVPEL